MYGIAQRFYAQRYHKEDETSNLHNTHGWLAENPSATRIRVSQEWFSVKEMNWNHIVLVSPGLGLTSLLERLLANYLLFLQQELPVVL
ncbi:hypothetical protein TNCV_2559531 [Trichonephila clavipes]|nr:hypothetical protein TNCV_2559531 [Trichonephila clavipes]